MEENKEKQIEEMARKLNTYMYPRRLSCLEDCKDIVKFILEDRVVLSSKQCAEIIQDNYNIGYERGSKETVEKYKVAMMLSIQEMQKYLELDEEQAKILYHHNSEIAKQFGDMIKE